MGLLDQIGAKAVHTVDQPASLTGGGLVAEFRAYLERIADTLAEIKGAITDQGQQSRYVRRVAQGDVDATGTLTLEVDLPPNLGWQLLSYAGTAAPGGGMSFYYDSIEPVNIVHADTTAGKFSDMMPAEHFVPPQTKFFVLFEDLPNGTHCVISVIVKTNERAPKHRRAHTYENDHNAGAF